MNPTPMWLHVVLPGDTFVLGFHLHVSVAVCAKAEYRYSIGL